MLYYAMISLALGELGPKNIVEYQFSVLAMIVSALVFTVIFSQIANLYYQLNCDAITE
jgi:hypothetical protein